MPTLTLTYSLPDEQPDYDRARAGAAAVGTLWDIDQHCRALLKHGEPCDETAALAKQIRELIREGCPDALEI